MIQFKVTPKTGVEIHRGQLWRIDWTEESKESLDNHYNDFLKVFERNIVYRYINMVGVHGVELYS